MMIRTLEPVMIFSFFLIAALSGSKCVSCFVSNQIAVCHLLLPISAVTFILPQPSSIDLKLARIAVESSLGSETIVQPVISGDEE